MQTELAQIISLTSYGNEFIKSGQLPSNYFPNNTIFQHCNTVDFRDFKKSFFFYMKKDYISLMYINLEVIEDYDYPE